MDWDKLRVFHAVADAGSLTHAGEQLHLSQSAISRQIRGLEEQIQATLFHRHARGLLLTEQGEILYKATTRIADEVGKAAARIRDTRDGVFGELRVTTTAGFGTLWLAPRLHRLFEEYPHLSVELLLTEAILDLPMRQADVAIRLSSPNQADLIRRPLMDINLRLYASRSYVETVGAPETMDELVNHRLITYSSVAPQPGEARDWLARQLSNERASHLMINSYFGVMKAAANGLGIAALPDYITRDTPELVNVLPEEHSPPITVYFVYAEELRKSKRVLAFRDFILKEIERYRKSADLAAGEPSSA